MEPQIGVADDAFHHLTPAYGRATYESGSLMQPSFTGTKIERVVLLNVIDRRFPSIAWPLRAQSIRVITAAAAYRHAHRKTDIRLHRQWIERVRLSKQCPYG